MTIPKCIALASAPLAAAAATSSSTAASGRIVLRSSVFLDQSYNSDKNQYIEFLTVVHVDLQLAVFIDTLVRAAGEHRHDLFRLLIDQLVIVVGPD